ncbi:hypothetical protein ACFQ2B_03595 [Streptomyces stramineus]
MVLKATGARASSGAVAGSSRTARRNSAVRSPVKYELYETSGVSPPV